MIGDTGSEFAAEFELACQQKQFLTLFVLPSKSPMSSAPTTAHTMKSSTRCTRTPTSHCGSIIRGAIGNTPTTARALTRLAPTSPPGIRHPLEKTQRQSVTNLLDEYMNGVEI